MAKSILRTALRLQSTRDAMIFGKTLSHEERAELRTLLSVMRYFKMQLKDNADLVMKTTWKMQFIREAIEFSANEPVMPFKAMLDEKPGESYIMERFKK